MYACICVDVYVYVRVCVFLAMTEPKQHTVARLL